MNWTAKVCALAGVCASVGYNVVGRPVEGAIYFASVGVILAHLTEAEQ